MRDYLAWESRVSTPTFSSKGIVNQLLYEKSFESFDDLKPKEKQKAYPTNVSFSNHPVSTWMPLCSGGKKNFELFKSVARESEGYSAFCGEEVRLIHCGGL